MRVARMLAAAVAAVLVGACVDGGDPAPDATTTPSIPGAAATPTSAEPTPSSTSPSAPSEADVAFGTGTVQVDGTTVPVSGDCDVSREFGTQPVEDLDDAVDVLLAVDNVAGDGGHQGPFAVQVRLLGRGAITDRRVTSHGAPGEDGGTVDATYEGEVEVAELRDRRALEFVDVATLHVEAVQQRVGGAEGPATRRLVVDVTCPISRPG